MQRLIELRNLGAVSCSLWVALGFWFTQSLRPSWEFGAKGLEVRSLTKDALGL